jgi:hypothetical protein
MTTTNGKPKAPEAPAAPGSPRYKEVARERAELCVRMKLIEQEISVIRSRLSVLGGRSLPQPEFRRWNNLRRQRSETEAKMIALKALIKEWDQAAPRLPPPRPNGTLDAFDLSNALVEPQSLIRHLAGAFERALSRGGYREGDRDLLDSARDYLRRHGIGV